LAQAIARLAQIRQHSPALKYGSYRQLMVKHEQLAFARQTADECVIVLVNAADKPMPFEVTLPVNHGHALLDLLNPADSFPIDAQKVKIDRVWPHWARILVVK
jgi:glycosidase